MHDGMQGCNAAQARLVMQPTSSDTSHSRAQARLRASCIADRSGSSRRSAAAETLITAACHSSSDRLHDTDSYLQAADLAADANSQSACV